MKAAAAEAAETPAEDFWEVCQLWRKHAGDEPFKALISPCGLDRTERVFSTKAFDGSVFGDKTDAEKAHAFKDMPVAEWLQPFFGPDGSYMYEAVRCAGCGMALQHLPLVR